jgi:hypothetical protein
MEDRGRRTDPGTRTDDGGWRPADGSRRADGRRRTEAGGRIPVRATASDRQGVTPTPRQARAQRLLLIGMSPRVARGFYAARGVLESCGKEKGKVHACAGEAAAWAETRDGKSLAARKYA